MKPSRGLVMQDRVRAHIPPMATCVYEHAGKRYTTEPGILFPALDNPGMMRASFDAHGSVTVVGYQLYYPDLAWWKYCKPPAPRTLERGDVFTVAHRLLSADPAAKP